MKVTGPGASGKAKSVADEAFPNGHVRHDDHGGGFGDGHYQPARRGAGQRGHIDYELSAAGVATVTAQLTAQHYFGDGIVGQVLDFFNPVSDIHDIAQFIDEETAESSSETIQQSASEPIDATPAEGADQGDDASDLEGIKVVNCFGIIDCKNRR